MSSIMRIFQDWKANRGNPKGRIVLVLFRAASWCSGLGGFFRWLAIPYVVLYRILVEWVLCIELPWKLHAGPGLRVYHGQALVVHDRAVIGPGCILRCSTTIGVAQSSEDFAGDAPVLGAFVDVGANVVIIGGVSIGDHAIIGAGSVVVSSIPPHSVAVGNPARVIRTLTAADGPRG